MVGRQRCGAARGPCEGTVLTRPVQRGAEGWRTAKTGPSARTCTTRVPTAMCACCCHRSSDRAARSWPRRGGEREKSNPLPSFVSSLQCRFLLFFFLNPATLWSPPGPPASSHLLTGGCHTTDIFSGDSWPCGTRLEYGNGF